MQKFEQRSMYDVNEKEKTNVHQDETGSDNELGCKMKGIQLLMMA